MMSGQSKDICGPVWKVRRIVALVVMLLCIFLVLLTSVYQQNHSQITYYFNNTTKSRSETSQPCPSVLDHMTKGRWYQNPMTYSEQMDINKFLVDATRTLKLPLTYQRADRKCGNVTFDRRVYFRAICDKDGDTPCCYNNQCVNRSIQQCRCPNCYDMRDTIIPEHADWIPTDPKCSVKKLDYKDVCAWLSGYTLSFIGDSIMRQFYTALLIYLRNNYVDGAVHINDRDIRYGCLRYKMFGESVCRRHLNRKATVCDGKVQIMFQRIADLTKEKKKNLKDLLKIVTKISQKKSFLILGTGGWFNLFNPHVHIDSFLKPVLDLHASLNTSYPRLLWSSPNYFNIVKKDFSFQTNGQVQTYMNGVVPYLKSRKVPIIHWRDMAKGILSHDGLHSSMGMNLWKVHIFMNYIKELHEKRQL